MKNTYKAVLSFKGIDNLENARYIYGKLIKSDIDCYFDYENPNEILELGLKKATEDIYGKNSIYKIILLSNGYFTENSATLMEWNAINNYLKKCQDNNEKVILCSSIKLKFILENPFFSIYYSNIEKLCDALIDIITKDKECFYRYSKNNLNLMQDSDYLETLNKEFAKGTSFALSGPSGTGKTEFIKSIVRYSSFLKNYKAPIIYYNFDSDLVSQEWLVKDILISCKEKKDNEKALPFNLSKEYTLSEFGKKNQQYSNINMDIFNINIDKEYYVEAFSNYIDWLIKNSPDKVYLIFDNIQRCSLMLNDRFFKFISAKTNIVIIFIISTSKILNNSKEIIELFSQDIKFYNLPIIDDTTIKNIIRVKSQIGDDNAINQIALLSKQESNYNLKYIELLITFYKKYNFEILTIFKSSDIFKSLSDSKFKILYIFYVAKKSIDLEIIQNILNYKVKDIEELIELKCLKIDNNSIVSIAHDSIYDLINQYLLSWKFDKLTKYQRELQQIISTKFTQNSKLNNRQKLLLLDIYSRLINFSDKSWYDSLGIFADYISLLSSEQAYHTIIKIYNIVSNYEINPFEYLGNNILALLLEAFVRTARIREGICIISKLNMKNEKMLLMEAKLFVQNYEYTKVIKLLTTQISGEINLEILAVLCNALLHKRNDAKVKEYIELASNISNKNDYYYILLRNTGHLFDVDTAIINIDSARQYFKNKSFENATCCNNLGLQYIRRYLKFNNIEDLNKAKELFSKAFDIFSKMNEPEIYQSTFNMSLIETINSKYDIALNYIKSSMSSLSTDLIFDRIKFEISANCLQMLSGKISPKDCIKILETYNLSLEKEFSNREIDCWLKYQINFNITTIKNFIDNRNSIINKVDFSKKYFFDLNGNNFTYDDEYGAYIQCPYNGKNITLLFATSPHWRY